MLCIHDIFYRKKMIEISKRNNCTDVMSGPESPLKMEKPQTFKSAAFLYLSIGYIVLYCRSAASHRDLSCGS